MKKLLNILKCKCPNCRKGVIFDSLGLPFLIKLPKMKRECKECHYKFEREPGYFVGAMYVSYGLAVAQIIPIVTILTVIFDVSPFAIFSTSVLAAFVLSSFNFRLSRTIWMYMFVEKK